ncbi:MAG TPA: DUF2993 domain-containing protein [Mycobacteriales bacterium]|nr:DUF2993 domain-containing protein [Mycobacteriales bacterium]
MIRRLVIPLAVLAALAVGADRVAAHLAANAVASRVRTAEHLSTNPTVHFAGFPFLTQAWHGRYQRVTVTAHDVTRDRVTLTEVDAVLLGVHLPLSRVLSGTGGSAVVDTVDARVLISWAAMSAAASQAAGRPLTVAPAGGAAGGEGAAGGAEVAVSGVVAGHLVRVTATLTAEARALVVRAGPGDVLGFTLALPDLPFGLALTGASATTAAAVVTASAHAVRVSG